MLLNLYATHALPIGSKIDTAVGDGIDEEYISNAERGGAGRVRDEHSARIARDAEEFELEGLMSDEEDGVGMNGKMTPATSTTNGIIAPRIRE